MKYTSFILSNEKYWLLLKRMYTTLQLLFDHYHFFSVSENVSRNLRVDAGRPARRTCRPNGDCRAKCRCRPRRGCRARKTLQENPEEAQKEVVLSNQTNAHLNFKKIIVCFSPE